MSEKFVFVANYPRDSLWEILSERTCEIAQYIDEIVAVELKASETTKPAIVRNVHAWRVRPLVPAILMPHIDAKYLEWISSTEWHMADYRSYWRIQPSFLDSVLCDAQIDLTPAMGGRGTRVKVELAIAAFEGPAALRSGAAAILSSFFRRLVDGAVRHIAASVELPRK